MEYTAHGLILYRSEPAEEPYTDAGQTARTSGALATAYGEDSGLTGRYVTAPLDLSRTDEQVFVVDVVREEGSALGTVTVRFRGSTDEGGAELGPFDVLVARGADWAAEHELTAESSETVLLQTTNYRAVNRCAIDVKISGTAAEGETVRIALVTRAK